MTLEERIAALERRVNELDQRTIGLIRLGPKEDTEFVEREHRNKVVKQILDDMEKMKKG